MASVDSNSTSTKLSGSDIIATVADATGVTKAQTKAVVDAAFRAIAQALREGNSVGIQSFGVFSVRDYGPREGVNPRTGEPLSIPAGRRARFAPSKNGLAL